LIYHADPQLLGHTPEEENVTKKEDEERLAEAAKLKVRIEELEATEKDATERQKKARDEANRVYKEHDPVVTEARNKQYAAMEPFQKAAREAADEAEAARNERLRLQQERNSVARSYSLVPDDAQVRWSTATICGKDGEEDREVLWHVVDPDGTVNLGVEVESKKQAQEWGRRGRAHKVPVYLHFGLKLTPDELKLLVGSAAKAGKA
jgi:hypothetical protein